MAHLLGAVVAVVEAELTTPQRPTAVSKGAEIIAEVVKMERLAEAVKMERLAEAVKVERLAEAVKVERLAEAVKVERAVRAVKVERVVLAVVVAVKIRNCLMFQNLRLEMAMASQTGGGLNQLAILAVSVRHLLLVQAGLVLKI